MPSRDRGPERGRPTSTRTSGRSSARTSSASAAAPSPGARARRAPRAGAPAGPSAGGGGPAGDQLVVGNVPLLARASGLVQVLAGLVGLVAPFLAYLVVGGEEVRLVSGPADVLVVVLLPLASVAAGLTLLLGRVPKLGLAYGAVAGTLAVGRLCIELYEGRESTARPGTEVISGQLVTTSTVQAQAGWVLGVAALALTVLAGLLAAAAWGRTVMEDGGSLDPARPALAGTAAALGALTVLCLALPPVDVPDELVTDPGTGLVTVVTREGSQALLERPGLALLGGLLLAGALLLCSVIAPSLRPRLAAVGGLAAVGLVVLAQGLTGLRDAATSDDVVWTVPGAGLLVLGLLDLLLAVAAWRHRPDPRTDRGPAAVSGAPVPDTR